MTNFEIGGNRFFSWFGELLNTFGEWLSKSGKSIAIQNKPLSVTNLSGKLPNPFTLILSFNINLTDKYQVVIQGDYRKKYREITEDENIRLTEDEMFSIVASSQNQWFKKNITD
jgi:hypothetical protein